MGFFDIPDPQAAAQAQIAGYQKGYQDLVPQLQSGRDALTSNVTTGLAPAEANYGATSAGQGGLLDALGINGDQGYATALNRFKTSPGFDQALKIASENIMRNAGATGGPGVASGATTEALGDIAAKMMYGNWQDYIKNLQPFLGASTQNAGQILTGRTALGSGLNQSFTTQGNAAYGTDAAIGQAQGAADNSTGLGWGILSGVLNAAAKGAGMTAGRGG